MTIGHKIFSLKGGHPLKKWIAVLIAVALVFGAVGTESWASSQDLKKYQEQLKKLQSDMKRIDEQQRKLTSSQKSVVKKIGSIEDSIRSVEAEMENITEQIRMTEGTLNTTLMELANAESKIVDKKDTLNQRLRVMYKTGHVGYLEVLLGSFNFEDMLSRMDMLQKIYEHDTTLLEYMQQQRDLVEEKKKSLEEQKASLVSLKTNLSSKQVKLSGDLVSLDAEQQNLKKDIKALEAQEDRLNEDAKKITSLIASLKTTEKYVGGKMMFPTPGYTRITSPFGNRLHPVYKTYKMHTGIDIAAPSGAKIVAALDGTVIYSDWFGGYGKVIMVDHGGGIVTLYAHCSSLVVKSGTKVTKGQTVAKVGTTGVSTGAHLHFEVRQNGKYVDPVPWVSK